MEPGARPDWVCGNPAASLSSPLRTHPLSPLSKPCCPPPFSSSISPTLGPCGGPSGVPAVLIPSLGSGSLCLFESILQGKSLILPKAPAPVTCSHPWSCTHVPPSYLPSSHQPSLHFGPGKTIPSSSSCWGGKGTGRLLSFHRTGGTAGRQGVLDS